MAKVPFSKLQANINTSVTKISFIDKTGKEMFYEVKNYLPLTEKIELIENIVNQSVDENGFYNPMKIKLFTVLEVIDYYTNLSFTEKMKEDSFKLYDVLVSSGIFSDVYTVVQNEIDSIEKDVKTIITNIYKYNNSLMGMLDTVKKDYNNLNLDLEELSSKLADSESVQSLTDILARLG